MYTDPSTLSFVGIHAQGVLKALGLLRRKLLKEH